MHPGKIEGPRQAENKKAERPHERSALLFFSAATDYLVTGS